MNNLLQTVREYPAVAAIALFIAISAGLAVFFGVLMQRSGMSMRPLVFFFGFIAIVAVPQAVVHLLDAWSHARAKHTASAAEPTVAHQPVNAAPGTWPAEWMSVFGADADPTLIVDAKIGLGAVLQDASDARISFRADGSSALAARFADAEAAASALNRYGTFFQFADVSRSDASGWTARRHQGKGEWNAVVSVGLELYAWSGQSREAVEARRTQALDAIRGAGGARGDIVYTTLEPAAEKRGVSRRLRQNVPVMSAFLVINVALATGWFFKASAWSTRTEPAAGVAVLAGDALRSRILDINHADVPVTVTRSADGATLEVTWRYADARWFDLMRVHRMQRAHKLVLDFDEASRTVRVREFVSAFDASAGIDGVKLQWHAARGMQFFQIDNQRVFGAQLDGEGRPTGAMSGGYSFNLQELKGPIIDAVTGSGWTWQPVMWQAPAGLRWLTE